MGKGQVSQGKPWRLLADQPKKKCMEAEIHALFSSSGYYDGFSGDCNNFCITPHLMR
jgi:hypothetical protein